MEPYNITQNLSIEGLVDKELTNDAIYSLQHEDIDIFTSKFKNTAIAAEVDGPLASYCIWPDISHVVHLKRFDLFQSDNLLLQLGTFDISESRKLRKSGKWQYMLSFFSLDQSTPFTREIHVFTTTLPKRDKFIPFDKKNSRDISRWVYKDKIHGFIGTERMSGTQQYFIDFQNTPDRYAISPWNEPELGFRRLYSFAAYGVSQYFILQQNISQESDGCGDTYILERGLTVFPRRGWRLLGSFYGFECALPGSNCYMVYMRQDPFPRMLIVTGIPPDDGWTFAFQFYGFDVAVPGTTMYQLQHIVRSISSTAPCVTRHRMTVEDVLLPWEFRMKLYVFPASLEDCSISTMTD